MPSGGTLDGDVIVVGAGPAGAAAAWALAGRCRVLLLEKARLPRDKLCSGVLTPKAVRLLAGMLPPGALEPCLLGSTQETVVACGARQARLRHRLPLLFASRARLDAALVEAAAARGADVRDGVHVTGVDPERGEVRTAAGTTLRARLIVGADGATGAAARAGHPRGLLPGRALALEARVPDPRPPGEREAILDASLPGGYYWAFPKRDGTVALGGGTFHAARWPRLRADVARWARARVGAALPARVPGRPVACFPSSRPWRGRLLLAGDAAGLADPLLGEGIPYALWSGRLAGLQALDCLERGAPPSAYAQRLRELRAYQRPLRWLAPGGDVARRALTREAVLAAAWPWLVERLPAQVGGAAPARPRAGPAAPGRGSASSAGRGLSADGEAARRDP